VFPQAGFPLQVAVSRDEADSQFTGIDAWIADAIAVIHQFRGRVIEPQRCAKVRERLLETIALSWQTLDHAETYDDDEWLPNPRQINRLDAVEEFGDLAMTPSCVDAGRQVLRKRRRRVGGPPACAVMKALFNRRDDFDIVLLLTGQGALPYPVGGPVLHDDRLGAHLRRRFAFVCCVV
jgi:hypothetical protein